MLHFRKLKIREKMIYFLFLFQGMMGPHSYKFGYSTGDALNPMARYEERSADGIVRGSYSFIDARGQKQVVHYESHPKHGFKTRSSINF